MRYLLATPAVPSFRRCLAVLLGVAYLTAMIGVPLPTPAEKLSGGVPFPCQGHRCGCHSAEQCWRNCCCFTPAQRLAWAAANRVQPPVDLALAAVDDDQHDHAADEAAAADDHRGGSCPCCRKSAASGVRACPPAKEKKTTGYGFQTPKCHGISTLWVTTGAVAPSIQAPLWTFDWRVVGTVPATCLSLSSVASVPAVPPPQA